MIKKINCPHCGELIDIELNENERTKDGYLKVKGGKAICPKCQSGIYDGDVEVK